MTGKRLVTAAAVMLCSPAFQAQVPTAKRLSVDTPSQLTVKAGASAIQHLNVTVQPGYHVNSDKPRDEFLIPLKLTWTGDALQPQTVIYPKSEPMQVGAEQVVVFTGNFQVETQFKAPAAGPRGPALMTGKLSYQACNNQMCFRPASVEFRLPVVVE